MGIPQDYRPVGRGSPSAGDEGAVVRLETVRYVRECSRQNCHEAAVATMTYGYEEATAVLGPLSPTPEPGALDLCAYHAHSVTVPRGWSMVRLVKEFEPAPPSAVVPDSQENPSE